MKVFVPTQAMIDGFARLSGDANPIHVEPDFCAASGFGHPVAHGAMLTGWLLDAAREAGQSMTLGTIAAMFPAPAFANEPLHAVNGPEAWKLQRVSDGICVCELGLNAVIPEAVAGTKLPPGLPLELGMQASLSRTVSTIDWQEMGALCGIAEQLIGYMFPLATISTLLGMTLPGKGTNYLKQITQWHEAMRPDETLTGEVTVTRLRPDKGIVDLATTVTANGRMIATGRALVAARDVAKAFGDAG
jgi:3-hydroxybutyryl-CoA dehydratase